MSATAARPRAHAHKTLPESLHDALEAEIAANSPSPRAAVDAVVEQMGWGWVRDQVAADWEERALADAQWLFSESAKRAEAAASRTNGGSNGGGGKGKGGRKVTKPVVSGGYLESKIDIPLPGGGWQHFPVKVCTPAQLEARACYHDTLARTNSGEARKLRALVTECRERGVKNVGALKMTNEEIVALMEAAL